MFILKILFQITIKQFLASSDFSNFCVKMFHKKAKKFQF